MKENSILNQIHNINNIQIEKNKEIDVIKLFILNIKDKVVSIFEELYILGKNTSCILYFFFFYFFYMCFESIKVYLKYFNYKDVPPLKLIDKNNLPINESKRNIFYIAFFRSILIGIFLSYLVLLFTLSISCMTFFIDNENKIKSLFLNLSKFTSYYSFNTSVMIFTSFKISSFKLLLFIFLFSQIFFNYYSFNEFLNQKKQFSFIRKNLILEVDKTHIIMNNIIPHCKLDMVENYIRIFSSYVQYIDIFPSIANEISEIRTRSFYTFVFLIYMCSKNLSLFSYSIGDEYMTTSMSRDLLIYIFFTYIIVTTLIFHIRDYFVKRDGIYQKITK